MKYSTDGLSLTWKDIAPPLPSAKRFMGKKVTCICPTGNRPAFVSRAIDCFLAQDYENRELLILDDGAIPTVVPEHPLIRYLRIAKMDIGSKRNLACEEASGDIIAHWDDDDWYAPTRLSVQISYLQEGSTEPRTPPEERKTHSVIAVRELFYYDLVNLHAYRLHIYGDACGCGTSMVYLKSFWQANKFPVGTSGEDVAFGAMALKQRCLRTIDGSGLIIVMRHSSNTCEMPDTLIPIPVNELPINVRGYGNRSSECTRRR